MRKISFVIPYYRNPIMLKEHLIPQWEEYGDLLKQLTIILIDDCSPQGETANEVFSSCNLPSLLSDSIRLYRVIDDIPWNQHGARNLGVKVSKTDWVFLMDMDRVVLKHDLEVVLNRRLSLVNHYKPRGIKMGERLQSDEKIPVNQFLTTRENFFKAGGYDEDYCGTYGGDGPLLKRLDRIAPLQMMEDVRMIRYHGDMENVDCYTSDLSRVNKYRQILKEKQRTGNTEPENPIRFEWERVF